MKEVKGKNKYNVYLTGLRNKAIFKLSLETQPLFVLGDNVKNLGGALRDKTWD